jgi:polar amino acid transport system permease protein
MDLTFIGPWIPLIVEATLLTILLSALALLGSIVIGLTVAVLRTLGWAWINLALGILVDLIRGTPLLVQLLIWYLVPPVALGIEVDPLQAAVFGLSVNGAAFLSEIIRGALKAVPKGQREAASAIGLGRFYSLRAIELPQAMPVILPAAVSFYIGLIKDTSIAYIVGLHELLKTSQLITMQEPSHTFELYLVAGVIYFALCFPLSRSALRLEARFKRSGLVSERIPA